MNLCKLLVLGAGLYLTSACTHVGSADHKNAPSSVDPGSRPASLISGLAPSALKESLSSCQSGPFYPSTFSIAHRGAPKAYPEHTRQGYIAAAQLGAGIIECDVTFTKDLQLVCRHSQCDLHRTTNILQTPLASQCSAAFTPATNTTAATANCCTSDITLDEFQQLCGRRDIVNPAASDVAAYLTAPVSSLAPNASACGELMTHAQSIELLDSLGVEFTPELKAPAVTMPFAGMTQQDYASRMLNEYSQAGIDPARVHPQSFDRRDVLYWLEAHPEFAEQAVYLDPRGRQPDFEASLQDMLALKEAGITTVAPPIAMLLKLDSHGQLQPSDYARHAKTAGLNIITWTLESGDILDPKNWMYASLPGFMKTESQTLEVLHTLATEVGITGIFSDWPGTVTYYANCMSD